MQEGSAHSLLTVKYRCAPGRAPPPRLRWGPGGRHRRPLRWSHPKGASSTSGGTGSHSRETAPSVIPSPDWFLRLHLSSSERVCSGRISEDWPLATPHKAGAPFPLSSSARRLLCPRSNGRTYAGAWHGTECSARMAAAGPRDTLG